MPAENCMLSVQRISQIDITMYVIGCFLKVPGLCFNTICGILQVGQVTDVGSLCFCESQIVACAVYTIFQKVHIYQCMVAVQGILSAESSMRCSKS